MRRGMRPGLKAKTFGRAVFDGDIKGPDWSVVDTETGEIVDPGTQDFGHTIIGRNVESVGGHVLAMTVIDYLDRSSADSRSWRRSDLYARKKHMDECRALEQDPTSFRQHDKLSATYPQ